MSKLQRVPSLQIQHSIQLSIKCVSN